MAQVGDVDGLTPKAMETGVGNDGSNESGEGVRLKKELSLWNGVAIIVGVIIGSGIFVSPSSTLADAGSKGMAIIVWVLSGILCMIGALCYSELGTMIPKSGGDYAYIGEAFGPLPAFLFLWVALFIIVPTGNAITALAFAENVLKPMWLNCNPPAAAVKLIAASITCILTVINCYDVKWVARVQNAFTAAKVLALLVTFFASLFYLFSGHTENLENMMENTSSDPGSIASAFYGSLFSFAGWNYLNFVTEELKEPYKNLPRAIYISMPVVIVVYILTNMALFAVLTSAEIIAASSAVAVVFGEKTLGMMSWIMPLFVALCTFGSLNGAIYTSSRLFFVGARNGHLPLAISLIDIKRMTPIPSLIFMCLMTVVFAVSADIQDLLMYVTSVETLFTLCSVAGLLWLRYTMPGLQRPIRVSLIFPAIFLLTCTFIIVVSCLKNPTKVGAGIGFIALGVPIYYILIKSQRKPSWFTKACDGFNLACCKLFLCMPEDCKEL